MVGGEEGGGEGSAVGYLGMEVVVGLCECRPDLVCCCCCGGGGCR